MSGQGKQLPRWKDDRVAGPMEWHVYNLLLTISC